MHPLCTRTEKDVLNLRLEGPMGYTKKVPGSPDLLFPTDRKWGHVNYSYHICLKISSYLTLSVTDKNTFSILHEVLVHRTWTTQVISTSVLRHKYTSTHLTKISNKQVVNMVLNVHRNHKACLGQEQKRKGGVEVGEEGDYMTVSTLSPLV